MPRLASIPYRVWLLVLVLSAFAVSAVNPHHPADFILEHTFTLAALGALIVIDRREPLSNSAYTCIAIFLTLHIIGAHYTYSFVPYDRWSHALIGADITSWLDFSRNHYDRLVHLSYGVLLMMPMTELCRRWLARGWTGPIVAAIALLALGSLIYELIEWIFAVVMSPEAAETYNGQQGDVFDPQKDMALALGGSLFSGAILYFRGPSSRT